MQAAMGPIAERIEKLEMQKGTTTPTNDQQPAPPEQNPFSNLRDDDYIEAGQVKQWLNDYQQRMQGMGGALGTVYEMSVGQLERFSRMEHPKEWEKYGKEIREIIDQRKQTKPLGPDDYDEALAIVKGRHFQDYVEERAQQMLDAPTTEAPGPGGGEPMSNSDQPELPENWKKILADEGMTLQDVQDMLARRQTKFGDAPSLQQWLERAASKDIVRDGPNVFKSFGLTENTKKQQQNG